MDNVLQYVNQMNRPLNATNVGDALGSQGVKKGLAQKYLETLAEKGKLCVKEAGKQKVYYPTQEEEALDADAASLVASASRARAMPSLATRKTASTDASNDCNGDDGLFVTRKASS